MASHKRTELTIKDKLDIIDRLKNTKCTRKELQDHYKISKHTINRILLNEDKMKGSRNCVQKRFRRGNNNLIDEALSKWYHKMVEQNILVNGPLIRQQAVRIARAMKNFTFSASNGWLWRWQQRENVRLNSNQTQRKGANTSTACLLKRDTSLQSASAGDGDGDGDSELDMYNLLVPLEEQRSNQNDAEDGLIGVRDNYAIQPEIGSHNRNHHGEQRRDLDNQCTEIKKEPEIQIDSSEDEKEVNPLPIRNGTRVFTEIAGERDPYSAYGEYIGQRLRVSADERSKYEVYVAQHHIDEIIFKLSVGSFARVPNHKQRSAYYENQ